MAEKGAHKKLISTSEIVKKLSNLGDKVMRRTSSETYLIQNWSKSINKGIFVCLLSLNYQLLEVCQLFRQYNECLQITHMYVIYVLAAYILFWIL